MAGYIIRDREKTLALPARQVDQLLAAADGDAALLYLALLSAVAYSLWAVLLRVNPVSRVAVYTFLQPIFGVILSLLLVDRNSDAPLLRYAAALAMICVSIAVVNRGQRQEEAKISGSASSKKA